MLFTFQQGQLGRGRRLNAAEADPFFANVVALLHMDGTDGSTTFTDEIGNTWTANGNAQIDTAESKFGGASGLFDGTGDFLTTPDDAKWSITTNDYTAECWINTDVNNSIRHIMGPRPSGSSREWQLQLQSTGEVAILAWDSGGSLVIAFTSSTSLNTGQWYHIAFTKDGTTWRLFIDGVLENSATQSGVVGVGTGNMVIGRDPNSTSRDFDGWIDEVRLTNGVARYTASFTPPTNPFPDS